MNMRDKIAEILDEYSVHTDRSLDYVADAILAALPDMIPDLVWEDSHGVWRAKTPFGDYKVAGRILTMPLPMNPQQVHDNEDEAKGAANAHHKARLAKAMGWTA